MSAAFGPAGNSDSFTKVSRLSVDAPKWLREIGLDCYEYQCGKGVSIGEETARRLGAQAAEHGIVLSLQAPYFINLANPDPESLRKTCGYITAACRAAIAPTRRSPSFENATTLGVVRSPSALGTMAGRPPSTVAAQLFVVPRSMPIVAVMLRFLSLAIL